MSKIEKIQDVCLKHNLSFFIVKTIDEVQDILLQNKSRFYCYVLLCDSEALVVGQGSNRFKEIKKKVETKTIKRQGRINIIFPNGTAFGHQKALTAALGHLTSKNSLRILIPTSDKKHSENIEKELKIALNFGYDYGGKTVLELNEILLDKRLLQLYPRINLSDYKNTEEFEKFRFLIDSVMDPSGCEMQKFKKNIFKIEKMFYPKFVNKVKDLFGGYYSDL